MLKLLVIGLWIAIVTAAASYFSAAMFAPRPHQEAAEKVYLGVEEIATEMTSVPMVRGGEIIGYVIIQLTFQADRALLEDLKLEPKPYLVDAAFRSVYGNPEVDFTRLRVRDIDMLTDRIAVEANRRIGGELVKQVLIQQLNYVRNEEIRTHSIKKD